MTALGVALVFASPDAALAATPAENTWVLLTPIPEPLDSPVFALAVSPGDGQLVLAGTQSGSIYRSVDGGTTWSAVRQGLGRGVISIAFNPYRPGLIVAGVRGGGAWRSVDGGLSWTAAGGLGTASPRAFGFGKGMLVAGTNHGVFTSRDGVAWSPSGLGSLSVSALAVAAVNDPTRLLAGADAGQGADGLPVFQSQDGGTNWSPLAGPATASNMVAAIAAAPLADKATVRNLVMGTNNGLFSSADNGARWDQLTGGGALPAADFSAISFSARPDRYYAASDGGGSDSAAGLWATADAGAHFANLKPPAPSVTALAVSGDDQPIVYVAGFRPSDHSVSLWSYRDAGGTPIAPLAQPAAAKPTSAAAVTVSTTPARSGREWLALLVSGPEGPYLAVGLGAVLVLMLALVAYVRRSHV